MADAADMSTRGKHAIANWLRIDSYVVEGLHILRLASDPAWIVRKDLHIWLDSTTHAEQRFSVDIDVDRLTATMPETFGPQKLSNDPLWIPILRLPRVQSLSQRVNAVVDGNREVMPVMRRIDVQSRLAAALSWMYLSGDFRAAEFPSLGEIARLQVSVQERMYKYLVSGSSEALKPTGPPYATKTQEFLNQALADLQVLARKTSDQDRDTRDPAKRFDHVAVQNDHRRLAFRGALSDCLEYCRSGHFVVVGMTKDNSRHIDCEMIPATLSVHPHDEPRKVGTLLGFDLHGPRFKKRPWLLARAIPWGRPFAKLIHRPSAYYFQVPVPELSALDNSHVTIEAHPDVAIHPAVLFHDHVVDTEVEETEKGKTRVEWSSQAYRVRDWISLLLESLDEPSGADGEAETNKQASGSAPLDPQSALKSVARSDLARTADLLAERVKRLDMAADQVSGAKNRKRRTAKTTEQAQADTDDHQPPTIRATTEAQADADELVARFEGRPAGKPHSGWTTVAGGLRCLSEHLDGTPHLELTPDDDPRKHVAHFHTASALSLTPRDRDRRPVVHGVLRASPNGVEGYLKMVAVTCVVSFLLAFGSAVLIATAANGGNRYNAEAVVAALLVVPGVSAALLGRFPGGTIRFRVLERPIRLVIASFVPPAVMALLLATLLDPDRLALSHTPTVRFVIERLAPVVAASGLVAALALREYLAQRRDLGLSQVVTGRIRHLRFRSGESSPDDGDRVKWHRTRVDTRLVLDLSSAAQFQAERPSRRFMAWLNLPEDQAGDFLQVVETIEQTTAWASRAIPRAAALDSQHHRSQIQPEPPAIGPSQGPGQDRGFWHIVVTLWPFRLLWPPQAQEQVPEALPAAPVAVADSDDELRPEAPVADDSDDPKASGKKPPTMTIEASAAHTVAGSSSIVSIISGARYSLRGTGESTRMTIEQKLNEELKRRFGPERSNFELVVKDIDKDRDYFLYSAPRFIDAVVAVPVERRPQLTWLIHRIWSLPDRRFRISYLHCPAGSVPLKTHDGHAGRFALMKVGLSFDRHHEPYIPASLLRICRATQQIKGAEFHTHDRRFYPDPQRDKKQRAGDYQPVAVSSAGPGSADMVLLLLELLYVDVNWNDPASFTEESSARLVSGSTLTAGGYVSRTFQFELHPYVAAHLPERIEKAEPTVSARLKEWRFRGLDPSKPLAAASTVSQSNSSFFIWVRWQLDGEDLSGLMAAIANWVPTAPASVGSPAGSLTLNLQYINNRVNDLGQINGKARYEAALETNDTTASPDTKSHIHVRRSLYAYLIASLEKRLESTNSYIQVSDEEPRRPKLSYRRDSEFNSY
jgi:hypothetical protein